MEVGWVGEIRGGRVGDNYRGRRRGEASSGGKTMAGTKWEGNRKRRGDETCSATRRAHTKLVHE